MHTQSGAPGNSLSVIKYWFRNNRGLAITILGVFISTLAFLAALIGTLVRGHFGFMWVDLVAVAYTFSWLLLATLTTRSVGPLILLRSLFAGFFLTMAISYGLAKPIKILFGENNATVAIWVPLVEELGKVIAVVLICWTLHRRTGRSLGLTDTILIGFAVGSGFLLHEDTLYPRSITSHLGGGIGRLFDHSWGALFPTNFVWGTAESISHPGWGMTIGFGVGLFILLRSSRTLGIVAVLMSYAISVFGHSTWNFSGLPPFIDAMNTKLYPFMQFTVVILAIVVDSLRRRHNPPDLPRPHPRFYQRAITLAESPGRMIERVVGLTRYRREWNSAAYARARDASLPDLREDPGLISWILLGVGPARPAGPGAGDQAQAAAGGTYGIVPPPQPPNPPTYGLDPRGPAPM